MHSKGVESISTIAWRYQVKKNSKVKWISKEKSIRNHEEENGSMHGFECKGDGAWKESILSGIEPWVTFP